jgi:cytoskeletal protein RodZ
MAIFGGWRLTRFGVLFFVGIILLASLVTGGVLLVKNRGEAARREEAVQIAEQELKEQSEVATQPVNAPDKTEEATPTTPTATESEPVVAVETEALPETGPQEIAAIGRILAVTMLALAVSLYVASRRAVRHL